LPFPFRGSIWYRKRVTLKMERFKMARKKINFESMTARFPLGTLARIEAVALKYEGKADFIREAVLTKLRQREGRRGIKIDVADDDDRAEA
jgi:hypothetical protein